jgi:hypothetical protein
MENHEQILANIEKKLFDLETKFDAFMGVQSQDMGVPVPEPLPPVDAAISTSPDASCPSCGSEAPGTEDASMGSEVAPLSPVVPAEEIPADEGEGFGDAETLKDEEDEDLSAEADDNGEEITTDDMDETEGEEIPADDESVEDTSDDVEATDDAAEEGSETEEEGSEEKEEGSEEKEEGSEEAEVEKKEDYDTVEADVPAEGDEDEAKTDENEDAKEEEEEEYSYN